jgi:hypothetical protein
MKISPPGLFSRGKISIGPAPHINPDSLLQELKTVWGPQGFEVYKSALFGVDVVLKKSGWTGVGLKIKPNQGNVDIAYNAFAPSAFVRMLAMGLIPILIVNANSWKPLLRRFEQYVQGSNYFGGSAQLTGGQAQLPAGQQPGYAQQQQYGQQPQAYGQPQPAYAQQQQQAQQPQQAPAQYPCARCGNLLQWIAEHQRWYCGSCQQYV